MSDKKKDFDKTLFSAGGLVLVLLIIILVNVIFSQLNLRWDVTKEALYSLTDASKTIISGIQEKVTIKVFYSKSIDNIPLQIKNFAPRLLDFLSEYKNCGKGKISLEIYNPKMDSEEEEWAQQYGIKGIDLPTGDTIYFGLVVIAADQEETLRFMDPTREEYLEYDITQAIAKVQTPKRPKIGLLSGLEIFGNPSSPVRMPGEPPEMPPWHFLAELRKTYDMIELSMSANHLDDDLDLLLLVYPKNLSEPLRYKVDQYVLGGGRLIVFVDPFAMSDKGPDYSKHCSLDTLFRAWGVQMDSQQALVDFGYATQFLDRNNKVIENALWLSLDQDSLNPGNIITAHLQSLLLSITGVIQKVQDNDIHYEPLVQSSTKSQLISRFQVRQRPEKIRRNFEPSGIKYDIAVSLKGVFETAFPDGPPEQPLDDASSENDESKAPHLAKGIKASSIVIIADVDMIHDNNYVEHQSFLGQEISQIYNDNLNFLLNASELMTGNEELINIRSRGKLERPFTRVLELEKEAQAQWMAQEQELVKKFEETNEKLKALEKQKDTSQKFVVSEEQEAEIKKFRLEKQRVNKKLKEVRRNLRADIEKLGVFVKFINIFLVPLLVSLVGIVYAVIKRNKAS